MAPLSASALAATSQPAVGFLLDVDGPIASPISRTVAITSIIDDLVALAAARVPIAFITGRSDTFIAEQVIAPLARAGLHDALRVRGARMFGVFEKGASWAAINADGMAEVTIDHSVSLGDAAALAIRTLANDRYRDTMFYDETKRAMISLEQRTDVSHDDYLSAQGPFQDDAFTVLTALGLGVRYGERVSTDAHGTTPFRIDPTIISTDIESVLLDKDRGAERAIEYFATRGALPLEWQSVGDSRTDYKMADYVHAAGMAVTHVDVRPSDGILDREYQVETIGDLIHDHAGAHLLARWRRRIVG